MSRRRVWARRLGRGLVLYAVVPYLVVAVGFALFQRKLLYRPTVVERLTIENALLPPGKVDDLEATTRDGLTLRGWLVRADRPSNSERPTTAEQLKTAKGVVLYFPGNSGNRADHVADCRDFTKLGADVVLFDYRGFGDNPGFPSEEALAADAHAIWDLLTGKFGVPSDRIVLFGESLGGGVATRLAAELCDGGDPPAGLVLASTFSSMSDTAAWHYPFFPVRFLLLDRYESARRIARVSCPIVCLHGTVDEMVPLELGRKLFDAAPETSASGVKKRFLESPLAGHNALSSTSVQSAVADLFLSLGSANPNRPPQDSPPQPRAPSP